MIFKSDSSHMRLFPEFTKLEKKMCLQDFIAEFFHSDHNPPYNLTFASAPSWEIVNLSLYGCH